MEDFAVVSWYAGREGEEMLEVRQGYIMEVVSDQDYAHLQSLDQSCHVEHFDSEEEAQRCLDQYMYPSEYIGA